MRRLACNQNGILLVTLLRLGFHLAKAQIEMCDPECKTCHLFDYNLEWHCLECNPGRVLWVDGCVTPCLTGYYRNGYNCEPCPGDCLECVGPLAHECTRCTSGFELDFRGLCTPVCDEGWFPDRTGLAACYQCDAYCRTCVDRYQVSCTSCYQGYYLRVLEPRTGTGECMQDCPAGYFRDAPDDLRCIQCGEFCVNCESLEGCLECQAGYTLYRGICYVIPDVSAQGTIDFDTYLNSGAGQQWDDAEAPDWNELTTGISA